MLLSNEDTDNMYADTSSKSRKPLALLGTFPPITSNTLKVESYEWKGGTDVCLCHGRLKVESYEPIIPKCAAKIPKLKGDEMWPCGAFLKRSSGEVELVF